MKGLLLALVLVVLGILACTSGKTESNVQETAPDSLQILLDAAGLEKAKVYTRLEMVIPDSVKPAMLTWITQTVAAASSRMTGGDYEDPDELVEEVCEHAEKYYCTKVRIPYLLFTRYGGDSESWEKLRYEELTPRERKVFDYLYN